MADVVSPSVRSRMMSGIGGKNTKPEVVVRKALFAAGYRFRLHRKDLPGSPDVVLPGRKVAIFAHGCFWHMHAGCKNSKLPAITQEGWGNAPLTLDYAAPEQIANDKDAICFKSDFFAIGVLMYHLIGGVHPFRSHAHMNNFELATAIETTEAPSLATAMGATAEVSEFVAWLMRKAPWQRPRTPALFVQALTELKSRTEA